MRRILAPLAALSMLLAAGCGSSPAPPDEATSEQLIRETVLNWHRLQAARDGQAACRLLTVKQQATIVKMNRDVDAAVGQPSAKDCPGVISQRPGTGDFAVLMRNTVVDAVQIQGDRATVTAHTSLPSCAGSAGAG